jgi:thiosulfate dehydrogenase [quinone] large subunit
MRMDKNNHKFSNTQVAWLVALRVLIGWHFLYEGLVKIGNPNWSSVGFLVDSEWILKGFYLYFASSPVILQITDFLNIWGLVAIGLGLMLGCLTRVAVWAGIILMLFYYLSHPPFIGFNYSVPSEGSYFIVNKVLIELTALAVLLVFPTGRIIGLDRLIFKRNEP